MTPKKCQCIKPSLFGKQVKFKSIKSKPEARYSDYKILCNNCGLLWGWMRGKIFRMENIPTRR